MRYISNSTEDTNQIAKKIFSNLSGGDVLLLSGELGAGKTTFTQTIAKLLKIQKHIQSPTFSIMNIYPIENHPTIKQLCHIDAYRLDENTNLYDIGLTDFISDSKTLSLIEWPEKISKLLERFNTKRIDITYGKHETQRIFEI